MTRTNASIRSYQQASDYLGGKTERPLANNTRIRRRDDNVIVIRLHETDIVEYFPRELTNPPAVVLRTGGWMTSTTKERLNSFVPEGFSLWQERGQWTLHCHRTGANWPWAEGVTIDESGAVYNAGTLSDVDAKVKLGREVRQYVKGYIEALLSGNVPEPSGGDCWLCAGLMPEDGGHILGHIEESYYVPSLLMRAIEMYPMCPIAMSRLGQLWGKCEGADKWLDDVLARDVKSSLTRYIKHAVGLAN